MCDAAGSENIAPMSPKTKVTQTSKRNLEHFYLMLSLKNPSMVSNLISINYLESKIIQQDLSLATSINQITEKGP